MSVKVLHSWKIAPTQPFYPLNIHCIGFGTEYAVSTYTAHTVNIFIFRNFIDAIENDKSAQKCYLHASLQPECIHDIAVGTNETVILLTNGKLKFFKTPKKLVTVQYLVSVKAICGSTDGFALIKTSADGMRFFIEIHPDTFQAGETETIDRKIFDISFDQSYCQSTWHQSQFKIKELNIVSQGNKFLQFILQEETLIETAHDKFLFFSIDNIFFGLFVQKIDGSHIVSPIKTCSSNIIDFWPLQNGNCLVLLLESGIIQIIYLNDDENGINSENIYFGSEISTYYLYNDIFIYSNGTMIEWGTIEFDENEKNVNFDRNSVNLPGIVALTFLVDFQFILAVSENCHFYVISIKSNSVASKANDENKKWFQIDTNTKSRFKSLKYELIELNDLNDNLMGQLFLYKQLYDAIKLKRMDLLKNSENNIIYRFIATCLATKATSISPYDDPSTITVANSLIYDRNLSFFVKISVTPVIYANEFNANLWNLRCRWLNDKRENEYVNIKLASDFLLEPFAVYLHLKQQFLPNFELDINTIVKIGGSYVYLTFPVRTNQPNYCDLIQVVRNDSSFLNSRPKIEKKNMENSLVCVLKMCPTITMIELLKEKLIHNKEIDPSTDHSFCIIFLGKRLYLSYDSKTYTIQLRCEDPGIMYYSKKILSQMLQKKLTSIGYSQTMQVSTNALKEYCVSIFFFFLN